MQICASLNMIASGVCVLTPTIDVETQNNIHDILVFHIQIYRRCLNINILYKINNAQFLY